MAVRSKIVLYDCQSGRGKKELKKGVGVVEKCWFVFTTEVWICQSGTEITITLHPQWDVERPDRYIFFNYKNFYIKN